MAKTTSQTNHRKSLHADIVNAAMNEFLSKGVRAVRMDDIAKALRISKRTLYEVYSNKEELLLEVLKLQHHNYIEHISTFANDPNHNVIDIIIEFYNMQMKWWANSNQAYFVDLQRYRKVKNFFDMKNEELCLSRDKFFKRGIEEGLFLANIDYKLFSEVGSASMEYVKKKRIFAENKMDYVFRNLVLVYIRGICTARGIEQLDRIFDVK